MSIHGFECRVGHGLLDADATPSGGCVLDSHSTNNKDDSMGTDIDWLNQLAKRLIDSVDGYREAADSIDEAGRKQQFTDLANGRERVVNEFQTKVRSLGGDPEKDGSVLAAAHRVFMNVRSSLQDSAKATAAELERGEGKLKSEFEDALKDDDVTQPTRDFIRQHWDSADAGHAHAKALLAAYS